MAKHKIIAARPLQILGHEDTVQAGTVLATIETDCEIGALVSSLQFGNAVLEPEEEAEAAGDASKSSRRQTKRTTAPAAAGDAGAKSARSPSRRR